MQGDVTARKLEISSQIWISVTQTVHSWIFRENCKVTRGSRFSTQPVPPRSLHQWMRVAQCIPSFRQTIIQIKNISLSGLHDTTLTWFCRELWLAKFMKDLLLERFFTCKIRERVQGSSEAVFVVFFDHLLLNHGCSLCRCVFLLVQKGFKGILKRRG